MSGKDTKQIIIEAAEELFASYGYHNTSLRSITNKAKVNLAAVNYHFGSKDDLMIEVIKHRLVPLNTQRMLGLNSIMQRAQETGNAPKVVDILHAFIAPTLQFRNAAPGVKSFYTIIGRALAEPDNTVRNVFISLMQPVFLIMLTGLQSALPHISKEILFWRLHFTLGSVSHTLRCIGNCPVSLEGFEEIQDPDVLVKLLLPFVTAGMEAPQ
jgi:AcrR family transcriptional regulator